MMGDLSLKTLILKTQLTSEKLLKKFNKKNSTKIQNIYLLPRPWERRSIVNGLITRQEVATAAGLTREDLSRLSEDTSGIALPERNNDSISPNGVPVRHHHGNQFSLRMAQRPVVIKTNAGTTHVTRI